MNELVEAFSIERVHKAGSRFDPEKAKWFNHQYLQKRTNNQLAIEFREYLRPKGYHIDIVDLEKLVSLVKDRVSFVKDIWDQTDFFFKAPAEYDKEAVKKRWQENTPDILKELASLLEGIAEFNPSSTETAVKAWIADSGYNMGAVMNAFRIVIVGALRGPHMFDIISWLGKEETLKRIEKGVSAIGTGLQ